MTSEDDDMVVGSAMWRSAVVKMNRRLWDRSRRGRAGQRWQGDGSQTGQVSDGSGGSQTGQGCDEGRATVSRDAAAL